MVSVAGKKRAPAKPCAWAGRGRAAASKALPKTRARVDLKMGKDFMAERLDLGTAPERLGRESPRWLRRESLPSGTRPAQDERNGG